MKQPLEYDTAYFIRHTCCIQVEDIIFVHGGSTGESSVRDEEFATSGGAGKVKSFAD